MKKAIIQTAEKTRSGVREQSEGINRTVFFFAETSVFIKGVFFRVSYFQIKIKHKLKVTQTEGWFYLVDNFMTIIS